MSPVVWLVGGAFLALLASGKRRGVAFSGKVAWAGYAEKMAGRSFVEKTASLAHELFPWLPPDDATAALLSCMYFETGKSFKASQFNNACATKCGDDEDCKFRRCAVGLIQFHPAKGAGQDLVGKTGRELAAMSEEEQLKYVRLYFLKNMEAFKLGEKQLSTLEGIYMVIHGPANVGKPARYTEDDKIAIKAVERVYREGLRDQESRQ